MSRKSPSIRQCDTPAVLSWAWISKATLVFPAPERPAMNTTSLTMRRNFTS